MAKSKPARLEQTGQEPKRRGRPKAAVPKPRTPIVVTIRAGSDWEAWIDNLCIKLRENAGLPPTVKIDRTDAIDIALGRLAEGLLLPDPPPRY